MIFCWFPILNWFRDHYSMGLPTRSQVYFGKTFAYNPRSRITSSISYSLIYMVSLISRPVLALCLPIFRTTRGSPRVFSTHLFISSYNPFIALLSCNSFMQVSKKVVSIEGSISWSSLSLLLEVEALAKLFFASMSVSCSCSKSNSASFAGALQNHALSLGYFTLSLPIAIPLQSTIFTFGSSSQGSTLIICRFWVDEVVAPLCHVSLLSTEDSPLSHDQTDYNIYTMDVLG